MHPLTTICDGPRVTHLTSAHRRMKRRSGRNFEIARRVVGKPNIQARRKVIELLLRACGASKARAQRQIQSKLCVIEWVLVMAHNYR